MKLKTLFTTPKRAIITSVCMLAILAAAGTATAFAAESIAKSNSIGTAAAEEKGAAGRRRQQCGREFRIHGF